MAARSAAIQLLLRLKLGCKDSNLGMAGPKPAALPLGDTPSVRLLRDS